MGAFSSKMVNQFTNPDGTPVEPVMTKQKSNGTKEMEYRSTDGVLHMTRQIDNKGTQVLQFPDGSKETWYTQGGSSIMIRSEVDGSKVQTNADGSTITSYPDGNKVQRMSNGIFITEHPDHSTLQVDPDGREIRKWPDGRLEVRQPDGTVVRVDPDGCKRTAYNNGVTIESRPDGTKVQTNHDGSRIELARDQTKLISKPDGSHVTVFPDGLRLQRDKNGIRAPLSPAGPLPAIDIDFVEHETLVGCSSPTVLNPSLIDAGVSNAISQYMEHGDDCGPWGQPCSLLTKQEALHNRMLVKDLTKIRAALETCDATEDTELMGMRYYELHQRALECGCDPVQVDQAVDTDTLRSLIGIHSAK